MRYMVLYCISRAAAIILLIALAFTGAEGSDEVEFRDWFGVYDEAGQKYIATFSGENGTELRVFIDDKNIHRLEFSPARKLEMVKFDHRQYRSMNFNSLYGYDHWIRKMKKHYRLQVWFEGEKRYEQFSLKGFYKAERWLFK